MEFVGPKRSHGDQGHKGSRCKTFCLKGPEGHDGSSGDVMFVSSQNCLSLCNYSLSHLWMIQGLSANFLPSLTVTSSNKHQC